MNNERVSVVIPAYNAGMYIADAVSSILRQPHRPLEIIVVNDGSTDDTPARVAQFGDAVTLLTQEHQGINAALNHGIRAAHGEWLAFLDADDLWTPDHLAQEFDAFSADPALHCVYGHVQNFYSPETDAEYRARVICAPEAMPGIGLAGTMLVRRADFLRVGLLATTTLFGGVMDWFARAQDAGLSYRVVPGIVLQRRLHPGNTGIRERGRQSDYTHVLKQVIERRRAAAQS